MTMRIALVDDNAAELAELAELIKMELPDADPPELALFPSGAAFLEVWRPGAYDAVVLDIYMGPPDGLETARCIRRSDRRVPLAFCTHSNGFASESYELEVGYYLRKPPTRAGVAAMLYRLLPEELERRRTVTLPDGRQTPLRGILFTEYYNHVVTLHLSDGREGGGDGGCLRVRTSQAEMERLLLAHDGFVSPTRGIIVNLAAVDTMSEGDFVLRGGRIIHAARRRQKAMQAAYADFLGRGKRR